MRTIVSICLVAWLMCTYNSHAQLPGGAASCRQLTDDIVTAFQQNSFDKFYATTPYVKYKQFKEWLLKTMSDGKPLTAKDRRRLNDTTAVNAEAREIKDKVYEVWNKVRKYGDTTGVNWQTLTLGKVMLHVKKTETLYKTYDGYLLMKDTVSNKTYTIHMKEIGEAGGKYYLLEEMMFVADTDMYADEINACKEFCK